MLNIIPNIVHCFVQHYNPQTLHFFEQPEKTPLVWMHSKQQNQQRNVVNVMMSTARFLCSIDFSLTWFGFMNSSSTRNQMEWVNLPSLCMLLIKSNASKNTRFACLWLCGCTSLGSCSRSLSDHLKSVRDKRPKMNPSVNSAFESTCKMKSRNRNCICFCH